MYVADTLSRAFIKGESSCGAAEDVEVMVHSFSITCRSAQTKLAN